MKKVKISEGSNYPKKKVLEMIDTFGLIVDHDGWNQVNKGWIRVLHPLYKTDGCVIIHKDDLEFNVHQEKQYITESFQGFLIKIGETEFKKKLQNLIAL